MEPPIVRAICVVEGCVGIKGYLPVDLAENLLIRSVVTAEKTRIKAAV
jgi:hypothetical protein